MPIAEVRLPDGRIAEIRVPEGATSEQIISFAQQYYNQNLQSQEPQTTQPQTTQQTPTQTQPQPQATQDQLQQFRDETTREVGLGARAVLEGAAFLPALVPDLAALGINAAFDTDIPLLSDIVSEGLSAIGLPEPETGVERVVGDVAGGVIGGAGIAKGIQALGSRVPKIIQQLAGKPAVEAIAGGASAGAAGISREMGGTPAHQLVAGLAGGVGVGLGVQRALRARAITRGKPADLLADIGERGIDEPIAFVQAREGLQKEANRLRKRINPLFEQAKEKGKNAFISSEQIKQFSNKFKELAIDEIDSEGKAVLTNTSKRLDELASSERPSLREEILENLTTGKLPDPTGTPSSIKQIRVNDLEGLRRSASQVARSGSSKGFAGGQVLRGIDDFLENATITGDQEAVGLWKQAIRARREFGQKFENPKKIAQAVDSNQTLETIERSFIGTGVVSSQKDLARTYDETLRALQPNQRQKVGFALRQSVLNRLIKSAAQSTDSVDGVSASRLSNSIRNLRRENKSFWDKFTAAEKKDLSRLETDLRKISKGGVLNKVYTTFERIVSRGFKSNIELPRTLKAKTVVTVDDLLELSSFRPPATKPITPVVVTAATLEEEQ